MLTASSAETRKASWCVAMLCLDATRASRRCAEDAPPNPLHRREPSAPAAAVACASCAARTSDGSGGSGSNRWARTGQSSAGWNQGTHTRGNWKSGTRRHRHPDGTPVIVLYDGVIAKAYNAVGATRGWQAAASVDNAGLYGI